MVPSTAITSPECSTTCLPSRLTVRVRASASTSSSSAPQTQVLPMPRATTAAWEVLPPRAVSTPSAATMPGRSSGLVSRRTRMTLWPSAARETASSLSKTMPPTAAPGEAGMALVSSSRSTSVANCGNISLVSCSPVTRVRASSRVMSFSSTSWLATRKAAAAVRLPTRVCSSHSLPRSMVNSMSHRSR